MYLAWLSDSVNKRIIVKLAFIFVFLLLLQSILGYLFLSLVSYRQALTTAYSVVDKVKKGIAIQGDTWDMSRYNADPDLPYPTAPGAFPLYVVTMDGFVVERSRPINGLFDISDYRRFKSLETPHTVEGVTRESWRMMSKPIIKNGVEFGTVTVASYNPGQGQTAIVDAVLAENMSTIVSRIVVNDDKMDLRRLDVNNIHYNVAFEITNRFNKVLINNGRLPSYIDPSYVDEEMQNSRERVFRDAANGELFLILSQPLANAKGVPVGLIIVGRSISAAHTILNAYILFFIGMSLVVCIPCIGIIGFLVQKEWTHRSEIVQSGELLPGRVVTDRKHSLVVLDGKTTEIPYASLQYSLLWALLSMPQKRWEYDELLDKMGENESIENRNIYDAMIALNKRFACKFILYQDKTYQVNPELTDRIFRK